MKVSSRLSLAEYSLYSGFVVLTLLQVLSLEMVTGPLSQVLRLNRLLDTDLEDHRLWAGHDLLYVYFAISTVWKTLKNSVLFPLLNSVVNWFVKPLNLLFFFRSVCYGRMNPTTYVWVTCRGPRICGLSGS